MNQQPENPITDSTKKRKAPETVNFADICALLLRFKWFYIISLIVCLALGYIYISKTPKSYLRTATILIKDEQKGEGMAESQAFKDIFTIGNKTVENQLGVLKSRRLMRKVVEKLHLNISYRSLNIKNTELYTSSPLRLDIIDIAQPIYFSLDAVLTDGNIVKLTDNGSDKTYICKLGKYQLTPYGNIRLSLNARAKDNIGEVIRISRIPIKGVTSSLCGRLQVELSSKQSSLVNMSIIDENANRAEDILNTLIDVYNQDGIDDKNIVTNNTANFIDERLRVIEKDLGSVDSEIEGYKKNHRLTDVAAESDVYLKNTNELGNEGLSLENQLNMVEYMQSYLLRNNKSMDMVPASIGIPDNGILTQINDYNTLALKRMKMQASSSERNPMVTDLDESLKSQRKSILRALDNLQISLRLQTDNTQNRVKNTYDKISDLPTQQKKIISIERQQKIKEELYLYLLNKKEENRLKQTFVESNCKIVDSADGSDSPVAPRTLLVIMLCISVAVTIPSLWLYIRSLLNTNVISKEDIKNKLSIPLLGELPFDGHPEDRDIMMSATTDHKSLNEAMRTVRENLSFMNLHSLKGGKVLQMISLNPDSGKTFLSINLAVNIALSKKKVIVLDLDLRKASLTHRLQISTHVGGISNLLAGDITSWEDIVQTISTSDVSFDVIPSGNIPPNPAELLKDEALDCIVGQLKQTYDYVLFDDPPYGMVVDALISSRLADLSIYVIRSGMFDKRLLPDLQELYESKKINNLSVLLNGVDFRKMIYNFKYNYRYNYYNYGYSNRHETKSQRFIRKTKQLIPGQGWHSK